MYLRILKSIIYGLSQSVVNSICVLTRFRLPLQCYVTDEEISIFLCSEGWDSVWIVFVYPFFLFTRKRTCAATPDSDYSSCSGYPVYIVAIYEKDLEERK